MENTSDLKSDGFGLAGSTPASRTTPCIRQCKLVEGKCVACLRTLEHIRQWSRLSDEERLAIMETLPAGSSDG
jgi:uncharacterized protein